MNKFKIGDRVSVSKIEKKYLSPGEENLKGVVIKIDADKLLIAQDGYPAEYNCQYWVNYKDCIKLNEGGP